jgi:hypothetical protein
MAFKVNKVDVWAGDMMNRPGMLARVLEALRNAGADLEFVIARRVTGTTSRVFLAPVRGKKQTDAAADVGLAPAKGLYGVRVEGPDRPGLGAELTRKIADAGINLRGLSAASMGNKSVTYIAFENEADAKNGMRILKRVAGR